MIDYDIPNKYKKIVYYGMSEDKCIKDIAKYCSENNKILVVLIPEQNKYGNSLTEAQDILSDDIWIYEVAMGMKVVLRSRAKKYVEYHSDSILYENIKND
tara:strand:- start:991 stop:1290 length:300 start_codon:yes stop_codon:yes gene_type:complete